MGPRLHGPRTQCVSTVRASMAMDYKAYCIFDYPNYKRQVLCRVYTTIYPEGISLPISREKLTTEIINALQQAVDDDF